MVSQVAPFYCRFPTIAGTEVVFGAEDDLWRVHALGGRAERITANPGRSSFPALSPDGSHLAFSGEDEGATEVYSLCIADGGPAKRLTFLGSNTRVLGWSADEVLFLSDHEGMALQILTIWLARVDVGHTLVIGEKIEAPIEPHRVAKVAIKL